jgi:hypothetical protein
MPLDLCPYFTEARDGLELIPYCGHKHSPARLADLLHVSGGASALRCGGNLRWCHIPVEKQLDID